MKRSTLGPVGIQRGRVSWKLVAAQMRSIREVLNVLKKRMAVGALPTIRACGEIAKGKELSVS